MDFKMPKSQEQSEQLQDEELEAIAGGGLDDLVKNLSLRGKVARWAAVAASVVGISVGMAMPAQAINRVPCNEAGYLQFIQKDAPEPKICFANAGWSGGVVIADVERLHSGNNAGYVITNRGTYNFGKWEQLDFMTIVGPVTVFAININ